MASTSATPRYSGPAYPFGPDPFGTLGPKPDAQVIYTSIANILTTAKGSVPYAPKMGSVVPLLLFEVLDEITMQLVRYYTAKDLSEQEPRIQVVSVFTEQSDEHTIVVYLGFQIVGDPTATVYNAPVVFPREAA